MGTVTSAAVAASVSPLYANSEDRGTITAGLRAAALTLGNWARVAHDEGMHEYAKLLEDSAADYADLAQRIERGELDQVPS